MYGDLDTRKINKLLENAYAEIKLMLIQTYSHLWFFISPDGTLSCWVKSQEGRDGAGIELKHKINVGYILPHIERYLDELNSYVAPAHLEPTTYFYCTNCGKVKTWEDFAESVFAGYYCKDCAKEPEIAKLIKKSHERGFYD